jgi:hypothetical protein
LVAIVYAKSYNMVNCMAKSMVNYMANMPYNYTSYTQG